MKCQFFSLIFFNSLQSFYNRLFIWLLLCHENVKNNTERPDIKRGVSILILQLLNRHIKSCDHIFYSQNRFTPRFDWCGKISYNKDILVSNSLHNNILWLKITMNHFFRVNMKQWDADHCENSKYLLFCYKVFFFIVLDDIIKTLIALFHYNAWKIIRILENI